MNEEASEVNLLINALKQLAIRYLIGGLLERSACLNWK